MIKILFEKFSANLRLIINNNDDELKIKFRNENKSA